ncbi:hypothetical protein PHET_06353, partial [Paragonimus heterotremus]
YRLGNQRSPHPELLLPIELIIYTILHRNGGHFLSPSAVMFRRVVRISSAFRFLSYSATVVRKHDRENYLCSLLLPAARQDFVFALRAFNVELAQIRDRVNNAEQANFRFQFWKDVVHSLFELNQDSQYISPIVENLREVHVRLLIVSVFLLVYGWSSTVQVLFPSVDHCQSSNVILMNAASLPLNRRKSTLRKQMHLFITSSQKLTVDIRSVDVDHALNHLGRAQGLTALIRGAVPLARSRRVILLPLDMLNKHCINQEHLLRLLRAEPPSDSSTVDQSLCDFFYDLACVAREQAMIAIRLATNLLDQPESPKSRTDGRRSSELRRTHLLLPRFMLPLIPCLDYLTRLERTGHFDPRRVVGYDSNPLLPLRLAWTSWRGRIPQG